MDTPPHHRAARPSPDRELYWRRKLGRLLLGVEPLEEQLEKYRRTTVALSIVPGGIGLIILALFAGFGRPGVGLAVAGVLMGPIVALAWLDYARLRGRVARYRREQAEGGPR